MPLSIAVIAATVTTGVYGLPRCTEVDDDHVFPHDFEVPSTVSDADALAEFAGRSCYQSWTRPNPATATNAGYLANILDHGHFSVLEHASVTLYVQGVSRALTHELVRHRHFSPSQLSQRFVDESDVTFVIPPAIRDLYLRKYADQGTTAAEIEAAFSETCAETYLPLYREVAEELTAEGLGRKEVREAARAVLPNCTETKIVLTGNMRTWREFFLKRCADGVDAEMREFAEAARHTIRAYAPNTFQEPTP